MSRKRENSSGCATGGCSGCGCVLTLGLGLALFGASIGFGVSGRIPFTESNVTAAGAVGGKDIAKDALPNYVDSRVGSNNDFINSSHTLTIGPAEGIGMFVVGEQERSPIVDLNITLTRGRERLGK